MLFLYNEIIYRPILNLLVLGYNYIPGHDVGVVIILVTILLRLILSPLFQKQIKSQQAMTALQPQLLEVQKKYADDREGRAKAMMELYKEHKVNPLGSCLPLLIQLPILFALYHVFMKALGGNLDGLYPWVVNPGRLDPMFLGLINLSKASPALAILAGGLQFVQSRLMSKTQVVSMSGDSNDATAKALRFQTTYMLPLFSIAIAWKLPAGLPLYWSVTTIFAVLQQEWANRKFKKKSTATTIEHKK